MTNYRVNTFDVCAQGYERLRTQSEFILVAAIGLDTGLEALRTEWLDQIQCCDRGDDFDFDAARDCVNAYCDTLKPAFSTPNPFGLQLRAEDPEEGCYAFLYLEREG